jgi:UDP-N-acetylglucosamine:LPS N-acetylglucosamine transferase
MTSPILLVTSSGGVMLDLLGLQPWWGERPCVWWAVDAPDTRDRLQGMEIRWIPEQRAADPVGLLRATVAAWKRLHRMRPEVVVSAGTGVAVPVFVAARLLGVTCYWVETLNVIGRPGLAARWCGALSSAVIVQHPELVERHRRAIYVGELY